MIYFQHECLSDIIIVFASRAWLVAITFLASLFAKLKLCDFSSCGSSVKWLQQVVCLHFIWHPYLL